MESDIKSIFAAKEAITFEQKRSVCYFICNLYETNIIILNISNPKIKIEKYNIM